MDRAKIGAAVDARATTPALALAPAPASQPLPLIQIFHGTALSTVATVATQCTTSDRCLKMMIYIYISIPFIYS